MPRRPPAVARVLTQATATMRAHEMVAPGDLVLVAVSGGPDSVCLLHTLHALRRLFRMRLEVFHFDHRLRPDSAADAAYVRRVAERLGLPVHVRTAETSPAKGQSVEAWATGQRGNAANDVRREIGAAQTAEGHTLDDQAETVVLNLVRGTGIEGIAGIDPGGRLDRTIQPLLGPPRPPQPAPPRDDARRRRGFLPGDASASAPRPDERRPAIPAGGDPPRRPAGAERPAGPGLDGPERAPRRDDPARPRRAPRANRSALPGPRRRAGRRRPVRR